MRQVCAEASTGWTRIDNPSGRDLQAVRTIRDEIDARVQALLTELR